MGFPLGMNPPEELMGMAEGHGLGPRLGLWPKAMALRIEISLN